MVKEVKDEKARAAREVTSLASSEKAKVDRELAEAKAKAAAAETQVVKTVEQHSRDLASVERKYKAELRELEMARVDQMRKFEADRANQTAELHHAQEAATTLRLQVNEVARARRAAEVKAEREARMRQQAEEKEALAVHGIDRKKYAGFGLDEVKAADAVAAAKAVTLVAPAAKPADTSALLRAAQQAQRAKAAEEHRKQEAGKSAQ